MDMHVKVLGTDRAGCEKLTQELRRALRYVGLEARVTRVDAADELAGYELSATPALVIDGELRCEGRIPDQAELTSWLTTAALREEQS
jgi:hypothetical protein